MDKDNLSHIFPQVADKVQGNEGLPGKICGKQDAAEVIVAFVVALHHQGRDVDSPHYVESTAAAEGTGPYPFPVGGHDQKIDVVLIHGFLDAVQHIRVAYPKDLHIVVAGVSDILSQAL